VQAVSTGEKKETRMSTASNGDIIPVYLYRGYAYGPHWEFRDYKDKNAWLVAAEELTYDQVPRTNPRLSTMNIFAAHNIDETMFRGKWTVEWGGNGGKLRFHTGYITQYESIFFVIRPQHVHHFPVTEGWEIKKGDTLPISSCRRYMP
jgi:hypothetical protein